MVKLTNRASETHEGYTFLSKVYEESNKIIDMLAKKPMDEESIGMCHVSISIENGEAKGIKKRECSNKSNKRPNFFGICSNHWTTIHFHYPQIM
jgi:hypothetical protein